MPQLLNYFITSFLQHYHGPWKLRCIIPGVIMAEHACSSFTIENDNVSGVNSPVDSLRVINKYYSVLDLLYYPLYSCPTHS